MESIPSISCCQERAPLASRDWEKMTTTAGFQDDKSGEGVSVHGKWEFRNFRPLENVQVNNKVFYRKIKYKGNSAIQQRDGGSNIV